MMKTFSFVDSNMILICYQNDLIFTLCSTVNFNAAVVWLHEKYSSMDALTWCAFVRRAGHISARYVFDFIRTLLVPPLTNGHADLLAVATPEGEAVQL